MPFPRRHHDGVLARVARLFKHFVKKLGLWFQAFKCKHVIYTDVHRSWNTRKMTKMHKRLLYASVMYDKTLYVPMLWRSLHPLERSHLGPTSTLLPSNPHFSFRPPVLQRSSVPLCRYVFTVSGRLTKRFSSKKKVERVLLCCVFLVWRHACNKAGVRTEGSFQIERVCGCT